MNNTCAFEYLPFASSKENKIRAYLVVTYRSAQNVGAILLFHSIGAGYSAVGFRCMSHNCLNIRSVCKDSRTNPDETRYNQSDYQIGWGCNNPTLCLCFLQLLLFPTSSIARRFLVVSATEQWLVVDSYLSQFEGSTTTQRLLYICGTQTKGNFSIRSIG